MPITHDEQREKWNEEHRTPFALKQMDVQTASRGVRLFLEFLQRKDAHNLIGLEMGCGKGRNVIGLARENIVTKMYGFDFSDVAIGEARRRAEEEKVSSKVQFDVMDATQTWKYESDFFDFGIDCFASTDIESMEGRKFAVGEMRRVLKPSGYFLVYVMSTDDEYHKMMAVKSPADEANAFYNEVNGKFEKSFSKEELDAMYKNFKLIESKRIEKATKFFEKSYNCKLHWRVYKK
ncbi:MAG: class I SAM-dependent methyltransferase [Candidatus Liptonbacteria bacterium]|nr:class I SAM-dependent methyltransferase [Candidatus Liptonbacteria bacterium]